MKNRIMQEIEDIRDPILFNALHWRGHALQRHLLSNEEMRERIKERPPVKEDDEIIMITRFFALKEALDLTAKTLEENIEKITEWVNADCENELQVISSFSFITGDGLVKNADWNRFLPVHGVCVVLNRRYDAFGRSFVIKTSYPIRVHEDIDDICDAIDEWK